MRMIQLTTVAFALALLAAPLHAREAASIPATTVPASGVVGMEAVADNDEGQAADCEEDNGEGDPSELRPFAVVRTVVADDDRRRADEHADDQHRHAQQRDDLERALGAEGCGEDVGE